MGVDIFFVISGFLISTILLASIEQHSFSFLDFYSRRIRRIFPALLAILLSCFAFGWFSLLSDEYKQLGIGIAGGAGFISNFVLWAESGYFDTTAQTKPLLHLWSLGIEEQFYIAWPLLLWFAHKKRLNLGTVAFVLFSISFIMNLHTTRTDATAAFYSPITRGWELLAGTLMAYATLHKSKKADALQKKLNLMLIPIIYAQPQFSTEKSIRSAQSVLGAFLIAISVFSFSETQAFPGWRASIPVIGAILVISAGPTSWFNRAVLSKKALVWVGLISYPLYLWHWPLLSFARILQGTDPRPIVRITAVALAFVLAFLTYYFIEKPVRLGRFGYLKTATLAALMIAIGAVGYNTYRREGMEFRVAQFDKIARAAGEWEYPGGMEKFAFQGHDFYIKNSSNKETTLFIGDSNIEQYYSRVDQLITQRPTLTDSAIFSTGGGCIPIPNASNQYQYCKGYMDSSLNLATSREDIKTVVIGGLWYLYLSSGSTNFDADGELLPIKEGSEGFSRGLSALNRYLAALKASHKRVFLVLNIPIGDQLDPKMIAGRSISRPFTMEIKDAGLKLSTLEREYAFVKSALTQIAKENNVEIIDPTNFLCTDNLCPSLDKNGSPIYRDPFHLRPSFVRKNAKFIDQTVVNINPH